MTPPPAPDSSPVGSVDKALVLLEILASAGPDGLTLRDVAERAGQNKASVHRLLKALAYRGYAVQDTATQRYRLGSTPLALAESYSSGENLPALFAPALASISQHTAELVHLGQLEGTQVLYLDKVEPDRTLRVWSRIGKRAPAARTAMGRAILAADGVRGTALEPYTLTSTIDGARPERRLSQQELAQIIDETAARGWACEIEENEAGIACVGIALVRPTGRSVAVSITAQTERMGEQRRQELGQLLREELTRLAPVGFSVMSRLLEE